MDEGIVRGRERLLWLVAATVALAVAFAVSIAIRAQAAHASSHSEAPLISQDPRADNTDLYAFVSPNNTNTVTIVANYIPLEAPASGPNFPTFDPSVLYAIHIDNNGDGKDDLTYQFRFTTKTLNPNTFLYNTGPIASDTDPNWNRPTTYSVTLVQGKKKKDNDEKDKGGQLLGENLTTPPDNVGPRSTPNYSTLAGQAVHTLSGGVKVFAGQRDDPFFVDLGSVFDLLGLRPFNSLHRIPLPNDVGHDALKNYNTHSIVLQVPISQLIRFPSSTIGIYASASRQKETVIDKQGNRDGKGPWVQVSRLGNPLINEVLIPLGEKDYWNHEDPSDDSQFDSFYLNPELAGLEGFLYPVLQPIDTTGRTDLSLILLKGVPTLNSTGDHESDLLRLNTAITPGSNGACPGGHPSSAPPDRLAVLDGDLCGFPNGRRLGDDVVDIEVRAVAQGYGAFLNTNFGLPNKSPNNAIGDGVDQNDVSFLSTFPYVATPHAGYDVP